MADADESHRASVSVDATASAGDGEVGPLLWRAARWLLLAAGVAVLGTALLVAIVPEAAG